MKYLPIYSIFFFLSFTISKAQTGIEIPELQTCDVAMKELMDKYQIPGASFAISKDGKVIYNRAFGMADLECDHKAYPYNLFRIASLSKPITSIAIMQLMEEGKLTMNDRVFGPDGILSDYPVVADARINDTRIYDITIQQLLEHSAGWDRDIQCFPDPTSPYTWKYSGCDPVIAPLYVTRTNGTSNPATAEDYMIFLLQHGLDFTPGTRYGYSNIGFLALGMVIETISGLSYESYVKEKLFEPLGISDAHVGRSHKKDRLEREVIYYNPNGCTTLSFNGTDEHVPCQYGTIIELSGAYGGWVMTAIDYLRLLMAVDGLSSRPDILKDSTIEVMTTPSKNNAYYAKGWSVNWLNKNWWHTGGLWGTSTMMTRANNGFTWAIFFNTRVLGDRSEAFWNDLFDLPWDCLDQVNSTADYDLSANPFKNSDQLNFTKINESMLEVSWTSGTGDSTLLVASKNKEVANFPIDGEGYFAHTSFANGSDLGDENYVLYKGTENKVVISNLDNDGTYYFRLFDFNQSEETGNEQLYKLGGSEGAYFSFIDSENNQYEFDGSPVSIAPTFADKELIIRTDEVCYGSYDIIDRVGKIVGSGSINESTTTVKVGGLNAGIYFVRVASEEFETQTQRFFVK